MEPYDRNELVDEPKKNIAHGGLARLDPVKAVQYRAVHDAAQPGHVGQRFVVRPDGDVAGAGAQNLHQGALFHPRTHRAHVRVEGAHRHGRSLGKPELFRPFGGQAARFFAGGHRLGVKAMAEIGERGIERGEELRVGQSAPFLGVHRLVTRRTYATRHRRRIRRPGEHGGNPVAVLDPGMRGREHGGVDPQTTPDF